MDMNVYSPEIIIGSCAIVLVVSLLFVWGIVRQGNHRRTAYFREHFGPEYDFTVHHSGSRRRAEADLAKRLKIARRGLRPLTPSEESNFLREWQAIQMRFPSQPRGAILQAQDMMNGLFAARGTRSNLQERFADLSVNCPRLADPYRRVNTISKRAGRNEATPEELHTGILLYRALSEGLLKANCGA